MNRPALAFGVLMPYIRSEEELTVAVEAWIRSHFLHKRVERFLASAYFLSDSQLTISNRFLKLSSLPSRELSSEHKLSINVSIPHSCKCVYNALILMSGIIIFVKMGENGDHRY